MELIINMVLFCGIIVATVLFLIQMKNVKKLTAEIHSLKESLKIKISDLEELKKKLEERDNLIKKLKADCELMEQTIEENEEKIKKFKELLEVKQSGKFLPICSNCKDIRDENGYWHSIEEYIQNLSDSDFSHSLCPECTKKLYPELFEGGAKPFCLTWKSGSNRKL